MVDNYTDSSSGKNVRRSLGEMLLEEQVINQEQLDAALQFQEQNGGKLSDILVSQRLVPEEQMAMFRSLLLNLPLIDLKRHTVQARALQLIPEEMARRYTFIPMDIVNDSLMIVMADPEDTQTIEDIRALTRMRIEVGLGIRSDIERAININYRSSGAIEKQVGQFKAAYADEKEDLTQMVSVRTPVAETLDLLIAQAVRDRASDVHIEPQEDRLRIRYRIDGILHDMFSFPIGTHNTLVSRVKILAEMDISEQRRPQDGQFSILIGENEVDIRVATMDTPHGERVTLRILDKSLALFTLAELGMQSKTLTKYQQLLRSPIGMLLIGGPTGSGKTTTLYASINELDRNERNIMTIEDPIEYNFMDINQTQVNEKAGLTFAGGLRAIMRHDPDVILVGEVRDKDTVTTAVQSALTGHLVLSSIHANDAVGILFRLFDLGVDPSSVSSTLLAVVAQRMVRRICTNCRAAYEPTPEEADLFARELPDEKATFFQGTGCNLCANTGYRGRTGLFELMAISDDIKKLIRDKAGAGDIKTQAVSEGMITLRKDGVMKVRDGVTSIKEVMRSVFSLS